MPEGRNLGSGNYRNMLLHTDPRIGTWHCGLRDAHSISRLRPSAGIRLVLSPRGFRTLAKKRTK
jgi:hypothetical protein